MRLLASILVACMSAYAAAQPSTAPGEVAESQQAERQALENSTAGLFAVHCDDIRRVVRFAVEADMLTARTELAAAADDVRVIVPQLRGVARLRVFAAAQEEAGRDFNLIVDEIPEQVPGRTITHVSAHSGRLILARDSESPGVISSIQLVQDPPGLADPSGVEPPVRLYIKITHDTDAERDVDMKLTAATFAELRRKHPRELNRFLRAMLRDFSQEQAVFGSDARAQWQVLAGDKPRDPELAAKIMTVLAKVDSDDYQERVRAADELSSLGQPAAIELAAMDRSRLSPEQSSAADAFLAPYLPLSAEDVARLRDSPDFLLDCLYSDDPTLRRLALRRLAAATGREIPAELPGDVDARLEQIEKLRGSIAGASRTATQRD